MKHSIRQRVINQYGLPVVKIETVNGELGAGILDKNGKEIFEGDLIKNPAFNPDDPFDTPDYVVAFDTEKASFVYRTPVLHKAGCEPYPNDELYFLDELEIVGHVED